MHRPFGSVSAAMASSQAASGSAWPFDAQVPKKPHSRLRVRGVSVFFSIVFPRAPRKLDHDAKLQGAHLGGWFPSGVLTEWLLAGGAVLQKSSGRLEDGFSGWAWLAW